MILLSKNQRNRLIVVYYATAKQYKLFLVNNLHYIHNNHFLQ
jgi:hypothetical protein